MFAAKDWAPAAKSVTIKANLMDSGHNVDPMDAISRFICKIL